MKICQIGADRPALEGLAIITLQGQVFFQPAKMNLEDRIEYGGNPVVIDVQKAAAHSDTVGNII